MTSRVSRNAVFALGQSLVAILTMFLSYRLVIATVGLERFGVWSLLLAGSALTRVGDVSGGGALARFVAMAPLADDDQTARNTIDTVLLTSIAVNVVLALALWLVLPNVLHTFIRPEHLAEARELIPYVISSIFLGSLAAAVSSGIDGAQRADQRAVIVMVSSVAFLAACWLLIPIYGVAGYGVAQIVQQLIILVIGWVVLRRHVPGLGWLPLGWRKSIFTETAGYALRLNGIGLMGLMFDPLAKFAFNHAGGPAQVAIYELASRVVVQIRGLVIAAATPLVPAFAAQSGPSDEGLRLKLQRPLNLN